MISWVKILLDNRWSNLAFRLTMIVISLKLVTKKYGEALKAHISRNFDLFKIYKIREEDERGRWEANCLSCRSGTILNTDICRFISRMLHSRASSPYMDALEFKWAAFHWLLRKRIFLSNWISYRLLTISSYLETTLSVADSLKIVMEIIQYFFK